MLLLDTKILSDLMRNPQGRSAEGLAAASASDPTPRICTSLVVDCEIHFGLERTPSPLLAEAYADLLQVVEVLPLDEAVAPHYARLRVHLERHGTPIDPNDTLVAAHALALGATLVTDNEGEFGRVPGLRVENWLR